MSTKQVRIRGASSLRRVLRQAPDDMAGDLRTAIADGAATVEADMYARAPKDTGEMAGSIGTKASRDGMSVRVGPGVQGKRAMKRGGWKAKFAEFGTKHHAAQPFVFPALRANEGAVRQGIIDGISKALLKIAGKAGDD